LRATYTLQCGLALRGQRRERAGHPAADRLITQ